MVSEAVWSKWQGVLHRPRFDRYFTPAARRTGVLHALARSVRWRAARLQVADCRDPKDSRFLALAAECHATWLVRGDEDLPCLHSWRGIPIVSTTTFMAA